MKRDFENKKELIGVDKGISMSVIKLRDSSMYFIGVDKGRDMPVVKLMSDSTFNFFEGEA